ncbi:hypothetical protein U9M48_018855 [Paspalum notatum var. saurae]|uniref:Uncharacterized protein n=1 Tax=Paspalum notatum var. saurae TaxID=547442 RepID=A0AAQ3WQ67_PASNO
MCGMKPFSPPCNLHAPSVVALVTAIRNRYHGTPPPTIIKPNIVFSPWLSASPRNVKPESYLAHRSLNRWLYQKS